MPTREELIAHLQRARLVPRKPRERISSIATEHTDLMPPVQLTGPGLRPTTGRMTRFLKACGLTPGDYTRWTGYKKLPDFMRLNPEWSMRSWEVLILENREEIKSGRA